MTRTAHSTVTSRQLTRTRRPPPSRIDSCLLGAVPIRVLGDEGEGPGIWTWCKGSLQEVQGCFEWLGGTQIDGKLHIFAPLRCSVFPGISGTISSHLSVDMLRPRLQVDSYGLFRGNAGQYCAGRLAPESLERRPAPHLSRCFNAVRVR
jgi:hypothetical protein